MEGYFTKWNCAYVHFLLFYLLYGIKIYLDIEAKEGLLEEIHKCFLSSEGAECEVYDENLNGYKGKGRIVSIEGSEYQTQYLGNLIQIQLCGEGSPEII